MLGLKFVGHYSDSIVSGDDGGNRGSGRDANIAR